MWKAIPVVASRTADCQESAFVHQVLDEVPDIRITKAGPPNWTVQTPIDRMDKQAGI
jgi:hypothetical protein